LCDSRVAQFDGAWRHGIKLQAVDHPAGLPDGGGLSEFGEIALHSRFQ